MTDDGPVQHFVLDPFQLDANRALDAGDNVLVAAPTGAGKTVVADHAVDLALAGGGRVFYTTPIKALSNQKYRDLGARLGAGQVGLLTGDNAVNADASVVVMTTEVLRNMLYAASPALHDLHHVVLDEVHFLQDAYRGPVWEEVIINLDPAVRLTCLSATVSNADEVADWLRSVRGPTQLVVETERPVELRHEYAVEDRAEGRLRHLPVLVDGQANPRGSRYDLTDGTGRGARGRGGGRRRYATPARVELIAALAERDLVPAIFFVFSRAGCEDAVSAWVAAGRSLADPADRAEITATVERHVEGIATADLEVLGYSSWLASLHHGVAAHHAGMVPPFKEAVEELFTRGLIGAVFATETLALGINMPARSVLIDKLTKFTGERHEFLTPAQYTQLAGRAGRRGLDDVGHVVVLWSPYVVFDEVAALASSRSFPLTSSFRPNYNMTANLVRRVDQARAHEQLGQSLAQFQVDREAVRLERRLARRARDLEQLRAAATCELGDVRGYASLIDQEGDERSRERRTAKDAVLDALAKLSPGDVVTAPGRRADRLAVLSVSHRRGGDVRVRVVGTDRTVAQLSPADLSEAPATIGRIELPKPFAPRSSAFQREVALLLKEARVRLDDTAAPASTTESRAFDPSWTHPVADCPDRAKHLRALRRVARGERDLDRLRADLSHRSGSLSRQLDLVVELLEAWGYVDGWTLTSRGATLIKVFHESDLLVAEALADGLFDDLDGRSVAALASCFTYQRRAPGPAPAPWFPTPALRHRVRELRHLAHELVRDEQAAGLQATRSPDPGLLAVTYDWAGGSALDDVLEHEEVTPGDFVRQVRQLVDLLRQIGNAAERTATRAAARDAANAVFRGVVSAATAVEAPDDHPRAGRPDR